MVSGRCPDDVCNELGAWSVSRGYKEGLKLVLTIWCPNLSFSKGRTIKTRPLVVWMVSGRCPDDVCNELGAWSVSRGCKEGLKLVLTIWCPNLSFSKGRTHG